MKTKIHLTILSPEKKIFSGQALSVAIPTYTGDIEVFPNHAPLLSVLAPGYLRIYIEGEDSKVFFITGGYADISSHVTIIADKVIEESGISKEFLITQRDNFHKQIQDSANIDDNQFDMAVNFGSRYTQLLSE